MTSDNTKDSGKILKLRRLMIPLTLRELSAKSGVSSSHLRRIERGERFPSARILRKLVKPLGYAESDLLTLGGYLSLQPSTAEPSGGRLDPYVATVLSQQPIDVQRTVIGILRVLKSIAGGMADMNTISS